MLNIKASLKPASDEVVPLNVSTDLDSHKNTTFFTKPSNYAKGLSTPHDSPVSENPAKDLSDTEHPTIKSNAGSSHLREDLFNPLKKNTKN